RSAKRLDVRRRAFDPFFSTRRDAGGPGLGLHIVYSIVTTRLGGRLDLDSEPGGGTRIQMILPRTAPVELAAEEMPRSSSPAAVPRLRGSSRESNQQSRLLDAPTGACHRARRRRDPVAGHDSR